MQGFGIVLPCSLVLALLIENFLVAMHALACQTHPALRDPAPRLALPVAFGKSRLLPNVCDLTAVFVLVAYALLRTAPGCRSTHF